jgi:hypothetical protein
MAAAGAKDVSLERVLGRPLIPLFRSISEGELEDPRSDEEKLAEIHEVAAIFGEEYAEGERNLAALVGAPQVKPHGVSEVELMEMDDARELFEEAGMLKRKKPRPKTSEKTEQDLKDLHEEFKEHF